MTGEARNNPPPTPTSALFGLEHVISPDDAPVVVAYRMGELEKKATAILDRLDKFAELYISHSALVLILEPFKTRLNELENAEKERERRKNNETSQFRLAVFVAIFSPVMSILISVLFNLK